MTLILRKCWNDGLSSHNFFYGNTGDIVTAPDWNSEPCCGYGLHGLKEGNGNWDLLEGDDWLIIEANDEDIVDIDKKKCKFRTGKILFRGTTEELSESEFYSKLKLNSNAAYNWALNFGNHDIMIHKITDSMSAYLWAKDIGNRDVMIHKINNSYSAYHWALDIGNKDIMIHKINDSQYAYRWATDIGNHDVMINKIDNSEHAYFWAKYIGNQNVMKPKVVQPYWIELWNKDFPDNKIEV